MSDWFANVNGLLVPVERAHVSVSDRGLLYGDGLYETIRVRNGRCVRFDMHLARLKRGAAILSIEDPLLGSDLSTAISELLNANGLCDARIRVTVTRGENLQCSRPSLLITAVPLPEHGLDGISVTISSYRRDETSPLATVKTLNCLASAMAGIEAQKAGADDAILLNTRGKVAEATFANVFVVTGNRLVTPALDQGCLPGTVRTAVLQLAPLLGLEAKETEVEPDFMLAADELFLTSAVRLARPIVRVDSVSISGKGNEACARIREALLGDE